MKHAAFYGGWITAEGGIMVVLLAPMGYVTIFHKPIYFRLKPNNYITNSY